MPTKLDRVLAFDRALRARCAERIIPFRFGHAYFNDAHPRVWVLNTLVVDGTKDVDPGELAAEAELLHTDAGHAHRRAVVLDDAVGTRLKRFFRRIGWEIEREAWMVYRGQGERVVDTTTVEETTREELLPFREAMARTESWATDDEVVREVLDAGELWQRAGRGRYFAVRADGEPVWGPSSTRTAGSPRSTTSRRFPRAEAAATRALPSSEPSKRRWPQATNSSSSSPTTVTGPRSSMPGSDSRKSDTRGTSSGRRC